MTARLTEEQRQDRAMTGAEVQKRCVEIATAFGYTWSHWRACQDGRGRWKVPVEGPLGHGWPDLFLAAPARGKTVAIEAKREQSDDPTPEQLRTHEILRASGIPVLVVKPSDLHDPLDQTELVQLLLAPSAPGELALVAALARIARYEPEVKAMLRRLELVFDQWPPPGRPPTGWTAPELAALDPVVKWQGVAFSLYSMLVGEAAGDADRTLREYREGPG